MWSSTLAPTPVSSARRCAVQATQGGFFPSSRAQWRANSLREAAAGDPNWSVFAEALGDHDGESELIVFNRTDMSSQRSLTTFGQALFPRLAPSVREAVALARLDRVAAELLDDNDIVALKLDTQGAEREILAGATRMLGQVAMIQVEVAFEPLYEGAPVFEEIYDILRMAGFRLTLTTPVTTHKTDGRPIEVDALFLR